MKPINIKETRQKEVRRLQKRQQDIYKQQRKLGFIKLEQPIRHGWYKEIIITENVDRYKNKEAILEIYSKINSWIWGSTKPKAELNWQNKTSKYLIYKAFPTLSKKQFNKLSPRAQRLCTSFQFRNEQKKLKIRFYIRIPKASYRIKFSRAYITHRKRIDPDLIRESDFIGYQLNKKELYNTNQAIYAWKCDWSLSKYKQEKLKTKNSLRALKKYAITDIINENILWTNH